MTGLRVGHGYDVHRLAQGRPLILGGVTIPWEKGLDGHSDADSGHSCVWNISGCGLCRITCHGSGKCYINQRAYLCH